MFSAGAFSELPFSTVQAATGPSTQTLTPALFVNSNTFFAPTVSPGAVTLTPTLYTNANTFFTPTVAPGAVTLAPGLFTNTNIFYATTVTSSGGAVQDWRLMLRIRRLQLYKRNYRV